MAVEIDLEGEDAASVARDLRDWLRREALDGVVAELKPATTVPGQLGAGVVTGLLLALKTKVAGEVINSFKTWLKARRPRVKVTLKTKGRQFTLEAENVVIDQALVDNLKQILED